ncbi:MAG TPA: alginate export family protein [Tepidisphaeraceae bacterium]|jgi:hypothetical protein|nr:alginate export family protein [Tepidisphaeraceae bacterium]
MRRLTFSLAILLLSAPAWAQYGSADFSIERWEEDYSFLKKSANRKDFFDPIKYVPLNSAGDQYLSFGGQARERYDYFNNSNFAAGAQDEDGFFLTRLLAHVDAHFGKNFRLFLQLNSAFVHDRVGGARPGDADYIDIQQAFADFQIPINSSTSALFRIGRQELIYGAQRLIGPNDWVNVRRTFDGAKVSLSTPNNVLDVFLVRPIDIHKQSLNGEDESTWFAGIYNVTALPDLLKGAHSKLDLYLLALDKQQSEINAVDSTTYTLGARLHTTPEPWDFDLELDGQLGKFDGDSISAWSIATEAGYTFSQFIFSPRASLGLDAASGSPDPAHRFNQLFPPTYTYLGHIYIFGRENIIDLHPGLIVNLTSSVALQLDQHFFWRQNTHDAVYNLAGGIVRFSTASDEPYLGNEFDSVINWQINRHTSAYLGYAHFFPGDFINDTGPSADVDFLYAAVTFTF